MRTTGMVAAASRITWRRFRIAVVSSEAIAWRFCVWRSSAASASSGVSVGVIAGMLLCCL